MNHTRSNRRNVPRLVGATLKNLVQTIEAMKHRLGPSLMNEKGFNRNQSELPGGEEGRQLDLLEVRRAGRLGWSPSQGELTQTRFLEAL